MAESELKLSQIGIIMLGVKETARSVAFYRDQLGLTVKMAFEGSLFWTPAPSHWS